ncbi:MAG: septum formation inhibitor Maf [Firmicutes bacterium]|nr:septum formation inhibitor Maf [Bacillota bacterium]
MTVWEKPLWPPIVLASASPRRRALLRQLGLPFRVVPSRVREEVPAGLAPGARVERLAELKARDVAARVRRGLVIGADTVVVVDGRVLGKPADPADAEVMLALLQGRWHEVYTGVAVAAAGGERALVAHERTCVAFKPLDPERIRRYVGTGEPLDKAGAYAIQGRAAAFVAGIRGCYSNVVGLPLGRLADLLEEFGVRVI